MSTSPHTTTFCTTCDSREWSTLADCEDCGNAMCDMCPGAENIGTGNDLLCGACVELRRVEALECECIFSGGDQADASNCELHGARRPVLPARLPQPIRAMSTELIIDQLEALLIEMRARKLREVA